ncbi:MAG: nucleotidyltransferase family protein [Gammaproteobacteria bacterium]|nr:nucleotidyltransferase family protein [Gammaproteobacteria bacterium]
MSPRGALRALVLAGTRQGEPDVIADAAGASCKALAPVGGQPMIERPLSVLLHSGRIAGIDAALPVDADVAAESPRLAGWLDERVVKRVEAAASPARTVRAVLDRLPMDDWLLVTTADHALLDAAILEQFLGRCEAPGVDAFAGLLPLEILEATYPDMRRTGLKLRDGRFSGCNLFLLRNGSAGRALVSFWMRLETLRKSPLRMALALGPAAVLGYGLRALSLSRALQMIGRRTGARLAPAILDIPEAAIDVDSLPDLAFVESFLAKTHAPRR